LFRRKFRERRAWKYLRDHPEDRGVVVAILVLVDTLDVKSAREVAQMQAARKLSNDEWVSISARWEGPWIAIMSPY
jgi:hypothetical protein